MFIVYYSGRSENTHRFVTKLSLPAYRLPIKGEAELITVPYTLIVPTYGFGVETRVVPAPVKVFLETPGNSDYLTSVIGSGNITFGPNFCKAATVIAHRFNVPNIYNFELLGTPEDVTNVQHLLGDTL